MYYRYCTIIFLRQGALFWGGVVSEATYSNFNSVGNQNSDAYDSDNSIDFTGLRLLFSFSR